MSIKQELKAFLNRPKNGHCKIALLPDFFLDRFISINWNVKDFSRLLIEKVDRKGGSIDGIAQVDIQGGNAINVSLALANLGSIVTPIICTSKYGLDQIKYRFRDFPMDFSHVKIKDMVSITTALEFRVQNAKTNVMLRDVGSLSDFGPNDLEDSDHDVIEAADYICLFNWAGTLKYGTALAQAVFSHAKKGRNKTYYDTADPSPNKNGIAELIEKVLKSSNIDILSVNENEAVIFATVLDSSLSANKDEVNFSELAMQAARILAKHLPARIDLHTTDFSASFTENKEVVVPTFKVNVLRATGAGDAWTAGNILGDFYNLSDESRLAMANAVSACYLSDKEAKHPSWNKLTSFLEQNYF